LFFLEQARTPQGFRDGTTNLGLDSRNVTPGGLQALKDDQQRLGYRLTEENGRVELDFAEETPEVCEQRPTPSSAPTTRRSRTRRTTTRS
jgi:hypothetical protein